MKSIPRTILGCAVFISAIALATAYDLAYSGNSKSGAVVSYTLALINNEMWDIVDVNNKGAVLIERQLVQFASPVPLIVDKNGKETAPFQCPGTTNDTTGEGLNNNGEIVGHCGHGPGSTGLIAHPSSFIANPKFNTFSLFTFPGAISTWAFAVNDFDQVVGYYQNQPSGGCCFLKDTWSHGFIWDKSTGQFKTIDYPLADTLSGGPTWLTGINNSGQVVGFIFGLERVPFEVYSFIYDNGTFTPLVHPAAFDAATFIHGFNNLGQVFGEYDGPSCFGCLFLYDGSTYLDITLPLPANAPRPDGLPAGTASLGSIRGLNDNMQFVGTYFRVAAWAIDFEGNLAPSKYDVGNFIASPKKPSKVN
jgi:hypothetical protein